MEKVVSLIEQRAGELLDALSFPEESLARGARYMLLSGGKRIRPLFTLTLGEAFGEPLSSLLDPAIALEMVHTYSLIHDDLPCMDNDDFRRNLPTLHRVVGEASALLTGDFLLTYAFEVLAKAPSLSSEIKVKLIQTLSFAAGAEGMIGGQALDLAKSPKRELLSSKKTGALFRSAFQFSAIVSDLEEKKQTELGCLGEKVGLLYQLVDDIVDGDEPKERSNEALDLYQELTRSLSAWVEPASKPFKLLESILSPLTNISSPSSIPLQTTP